MLGTGSAAFAASPRKADGFTSPKTPVAVTAADRNSGGRDAHQGNEGRDDAHRGDNGRRDANLHGDRRDHRDMDHGRWYGNAWDHRGGTRYGWSWEQQCECLVQRPGLVQRILRRSPARRGHPTSGITGTGRLGGSRPGVQRRQSRSA